MKLLHIVTSVDPRRGGVAESIRARGVTLLAMGHEVEVLTLDAAQEVATLAYPLPLHTVGPRRSGWAFAPALAPWLRQHARRFDAVIVDGIWQYHGVAAQHVLRNLQVPYFVFPHGMLGLWFKRHHPLKHAKKWLAWLLFDYWVLRRAHGVLYSCEEEMRQAAQSFWLYRAHARVVSFGTASPPPRQQQPSTALHHRHAELAGQRVLLFLGRIHPVKGIDVLLQAFADAAAGHDDVRLAIAGPGDEALVQQLKQQAQGLGIDGRISWLGMLDAASKWEALRGAEALVLPSHHENFGVVVAEALACGVPVLISDQVNIWREIDAGGAGLVAPDTVDGTAHNLRRWLSLDSAARAEMAACALQTYQRHFRVEAMATSLLRAIEEMAGVPAAGRSPLPRTRS
jgi:glycosyltransferase involved in cell wall biosynthesis